MILRAEPSSIPHGGRARRAAVLFLLVAPTLGAVAPASSQVFRLEAGSSSLYRANGGILEMESDPFGGWFGVGGFDRVRFGGALRLRSHTADFTLGDEVTPLGLPTDVFDASHALCTRGLGVGLGRGGTRLSLIGGTTSSLYSTPYLIAGRPGRPIGLLGLETRLGSQLTLGVRDLVYQRQTHLLGLQWQPNEAMQAAVTGGRGANEPFVAGSFVYRGDRFSIRSAYVSAGDGFHRVLSEQAEGSEIDRENLLITFRPTRRSALSLGRNHYLQPSLAGRPALRGSVDQVLGNAAVAGIAFDAAWFHSESPQAGGFGASVGGARDLGRALRAEVHVQHAEPRRGPPTTAWVGQIRERISQRVDLVQVLTHSAGETTVSWGGSFLSNLLTVGIEYQTIYLPFADSNPFRQALTLSAKLQLSGNFQFHAATLLGPDGRVRYTVYGDQYLYRSEAAKPVAGSLSRFLVQGSVLDEIGQPVEGAALRVGRQEIFTDSRGTFFVRSKRGGRQRLEIMPEAFLGPGRFEVSSAPESVVSMREDQGVPVTIVVRRAATSGVAAQTPDQPDRLLHVSESALMAEDSALAIVRVPPMAVVARLSPSVHFGFNSATLAGSSCIMLDSIAATMRRSPTLTVQVDGHSDRRGPPAYNRELSRRRAEHVREYLAGAGIDGRRITARWHGQSHPFTWGTDPLSNARNRRVEFTYRGREIEVAAEQGQDLQIGEPR
jgi:outer membrane protein OmpA-like peptidoglycan-associated protein